jgi:hypothetical protein
LKIYLASHRNSFRLQKICLIHYKVIFDVDYFFIRSFVLTRRWALWRRVWSRREKSQASEDWRQSRHWLESQRYNFSCAIYQAEKNA